MIPTRPSRRVLREAAKRLHHIVGVLATQSGAETMRTQERIAWIMAMVMQEWYEDMGIPLREWLGPDPRKGDDYVPSRIPMPPPRVALADRERVEHRCAVHKIVYVSKRTFEDHALAVRYALDEAMLCDVSYEAARAGVEYLRHCVSAKPGSFFFPAICPERQAWLVSRGLPALANQSAESKAWIHETGLKLRQAYSVTLSRVEGGAELHRCPVHSEMNSHGRKHSLEQHVLNLTRHVKLGAYTHYANKKCTQAIQYLQEAVYNKSDPSKVNRLCDPRRDFLVSKGMQPLYNQSPDSRKVLRWWTAIVHRQWHVSHREEPSEWLPHFCKSIHWHLCPDLRDGERTAETEIAALGEVASGAVVSRSRHRRAMQSIHYLMHGTGYKRGGRPFVSMRDKGKPRKNTGGHPKPRDFYSKRRMCLERRGRLLRFGLLPIKRGYRSRVYLDRLRKTVLVPRTHFQEPFLPLEERWLRTEELYHGADRALHWAGC